MNSALGWMEFAYRVATGELQPTAPLTGDMQSRLKLPSIADNHRVKDPDNVKVRTLFSRLGHTDAYREKLTTDVALGSMLHVVQDSFSASHTCRVARLVDGKRYAVLNDVFNYNDQNRQSHALFDGHPAWMVEYAEKGVHMYENDPVAVGAWLIGAADRKLDWETVKAHLRASIFARTASETSEAGSKCIGGPS